MATRKKTAAVPWDEWAASQESTHVGALVETLEDTSLPKLEARFLMLSTWPKTPAFGAAAASFFSASPFGFASSSAPASRRSASS